MRHHKYIVTGLILLSPPMVHADIYDVLRTSQNQGGANNLTINDVQNPNNINQMIAQAGQGGQPTAQSAQPAYKPTTLRDEAFTELLNKTFPLRPDQIVTLHKNYDQEQLAINTPANTPPQPVSSTLTVDLSPGATPPVIRLATGFVSSIVFVDSTGKPWPVADYSLGNPQGFNIKWDNKTNTLFLQSVKDRLSGNIAIRMADLDTPLMFSIVTGQKEVDYRIDVQVPGIGPNSTSPVLETNMPDVAAQYLLSALDGIPPSGSIELNVAKDYGRAWSYNGKLLFRTKLNVLSPAWSATVSSADGTHVYEMTPTPLILASQNGKTIKIELSGL